MKKISLLLCLVVIICTICGCNNSKDEKTSTVTKKGIFSKSISGNITAASEFSEGLAFVSLEGEKDKTYCINKKGEIVYEIDKQISAGGWIFNKFHNGYTLIDDAICDKKGDLTYPADVGVTKFSLLAIEDGYIIAEVKNTTFDSTETKIGVMDTSFKWVIEPSDEIGKKLGGLPVEAVNTNSYYQKGIVCFEINDGDIKYLYFNVKTSEIFEKSPYPLPSNKWLRSANGSYGNYNEEIMLDLSEKYDNIYNTTEFINGKAGIVFCNRLENEYFVTLINEKGEFQFQPVSCGEYANQIIYDGKYILITYGGSITGDNAKCYDNKGNLISEITKDIFPDKNWAYSYSLSDGVIEVRGGYNGANKYYFYSPNGEELF